MLNRWSIQLCSPIWLQKIHLHANPFSAHSLHTAHSLITMFFALENFNLPLRKDPITSHLKHPNQTPIPSEPLTDVRAETSLPTEHSVHICSPLSLSRSQCNTANQQRCSHFTDETQKGRPDSSDLANWEQYYG